MAFFFRTNVRNIFRIRIIVRIFVHNIINNAMILTYYRMTGEELNRIYNEAKLKNKKLSVDEFADRIGIGRTKLYGLFKLGQIDEKDAKTIEDHLKNDPELGQYRTLMKVGPDVRPTDHHGTLAIASQSPSPDLWGKALDMLNDTLVLLKGTIDTIRDDNKFIKEDAEVLRSVVKKAVQEGSIRYAKPPR